TSVFVVGVSLIPMPAPYAFIELDAELVRYRVARQALAGITVTDATYVGEIDCPGTVAADGRLSGLLAPAAGTAVDYRWTPKGVAITVSNPGEGLASFTFPDGAA